LSITNKYHVQSIKAHESYEWLLHKHYLKRIPPISYAFGLYEEHDLIGVCTFGVPASFSLCMGICGLEYKDMVFELNRLCVNDNIYKNSLSFFVSQCLKQLPKPRIIVSYADTSVGHNGYIYQATNWFYTGLSAKRTERYDPENPNKHSKTVIGKKNIKYTDLAVRQRPQKHRYIYFLGDKKEKKIFKQALNYEILPYPKGDNDRYDSSYEPSTQRNLFS